MATSDATTFLPDVGELVEEAYERAGLTLRSGYDLRTARRSIDLMMLEWQNRGINLWTVEELKYDSLGTGLGTETLVDGTSSYNLRSNTIAVLEVLLRENDENVSTQVDYELNRISRDTHASIPTKLTKGRPSECYVERKQATVTLNLWPVPDSSTKYKLVYHRVRRVEDSGPGGTYDADVPDRFWPALVSGLAYNISLKRPESVGRVQMLKQLYEEQFALAASEDREKVSVRFYPGGYS